MSEERYLISIQTKDGENQFILDKDSYRKYLVDENFRNQLSQIDESCPSITIDDEKEDEEKEDEEKEDEEKLSEHSSPSSKEDSSESFPTTSNSKGNADEEVKEEVEKFECHYCEVYFSKKCNLVKHTRNFHPELAKKIAVPEGNKICGICHVRFRSLLELQNHIQNQHDVALSFIEKLFYTEADFQQWKTRMERDSQSSFVFNSSVSNKEKGTKTTYYGCHRSGSAVIKTDRKRHLKASGSIKTNITCPAVMKVNTETVGDHTKIKVNYQAIHVGHEMDVETMRLTREERLAIASSLQAGVPIGHVLEQIRTQYPSTTKAGSIQRKDLHNIRRDFNVRTSLGNETRYRAKRQLKIETPHDDSFETEVNTPLLHKSRDPDIVTLLPETREPGTVNILRKPRNPEVSTLVVVHNPLDPDMGALLPKPRDPDIIREEAISDVRSLLQRLEQCNSVTIMEDASHQAKRLCTKMDADQALSGLSFLPWQSKTASNQEMEQQKLAMKKKRAKKTVVKAEVFANSYILS